MTRIPRAFAAALLGSTMLVVAMPAAAQSEARVERLERQVNALQRAVFPGGDERFFEPEIQPETRAPATAIPQASASTLTGVLERLDAIEAQVARLTAATEVNENAHSAMELRLAALEAGQVPAPPAQRGNTGANATGVIQVPDENVSLPANDSRPTPQQSGPSAERVAAVQAIVKPASGDAGEDEYTYGFRLWEAGFYPEAQQQLALYVERYPSHRLISYGRNLLGRAFLDAGNPRAAATHFFDNYQADNAAPRAPDSLLYLAESMIALGDTSRACIALAEFGDTYPALATGRLSTMYTGLNGRVDCD